jgi:hypothetical protein
MKEPTFDKDGYPTDETLEAIEKWNPKDTPGLFAFMKKAWSYPHYFTEEYCTNFKGAPGYLYKISTGGWSGNESIIEAFEANYIAWIFTWVSSRRGGHYEFEVRERK